MSINSELKKEGIEILSKLDTLQVNTIASSIASKLCLAFPEHNLIRSDLFETICRINMYIANMPNDSSNAKYFYKNNSIYFSDTLNLKEMANLSVHECLHCIQEIKDSNNNLVKMGLYNISKNTGLGLNEASVQLMASEANFNDETEEIYYNISLNTISPNYYPLECCLLNQMTYFTGTYPLYHSTLNSNDIFKNTFIAKSDKKTYNTIEKNFDKLLELENDLNYFISELQTADKIKSIKLLNTLIQSRKNNIINLFFETQNLIIKKCFISEFNYIRNLNDIKSFTKKLYNYKNVMGNSENYSFYNEFYRYVIDLIEYKKAFIEEHGSLDIFNDVSNNSLVVVENAQTNFAFAINFINKIKKLFGLNKLKQSSNKLY